MGVKDILIYVEISIPMKQEEQEMDVKKLKCCLYFTIFILVTGLGSASCSTGNKIITPDGTPFVSGYIYKPKSPGPHPAVILLHGSVGIQPANHKLAKILTRHGYVSVVLDYYDEIGGLPPGSNRWDEKWPGWKNNIIKGVKYIQSLPEVKKDHIGFIGFSRGGNLGLHISGEIPSIKAVVAYYPATRLVDANKLPPVLFLHGRKDTIIPLFKAENLYKTILDSGRTAELKIYDRAGHGFERYTNKSKYVPSASQDAQKRTIIFLDKYLKTP